MPELPEVENRLLYLRRTALGECIDRVVVTAPGMIKTPTAARFEKALRGRCLQSAYRRGKYLIVTLDDGRALILHFGMGGDLAYYASPAERPQFTRIEFMLASGRRLAFTCPRKICRVMLVDKISDVPALDRMGPEPLDKTFSLAYLEQAIDESQSRQIKPLLMDQKRIAGVGNIYADEILFCAGVRPDRKAASLSLDEIKRIHRETRRVLRLAVRVGGDEQSPSDFILSRNARGARCKTCGHPIKNKKIGGRTAYFCPHCQA
jgi:formamidopyrimidine-DNA glycosylase